MAVSTMEGSTSNTLTAVPSSCQRNVFEKLCNAALDAQ